MVQSKKNSIEVFSPLTEKSEKYYFVCEKFQEKTFSIKSVHALTRKPELFPTTQKPDKTPKNPKFSDVNSIAGCQGHLRVVSPKKHLGVFDRTGGDLS